MKIISLEGENLASLAAPFHINFAKGILADAGLFAISGNTGAGKSTLLDAICLALFDAMPRFSNSRRGAAIGHAQSEESERVKSNDVRHILTRGAANGFAQVEFALDNGQHYQAKWSVKRARNSARGRLQAQEMQLVDCKDNQVLATKKTEVLALIESLIGLNYEQFKRSVLLAQGDFAAFLKAPAKERSELLERITGTQLYSQISKQAFAQAKEQEQNLLLLESKIGEVKLLSTEQQQALVGQLTALNDQVADVERQKKLLQWLGDKLTAKTQVQNNLVEDKERLSQALQAIKQQDSINQILDKIEQAQDARVVFAQQAKYKKELTDQQQAVEELSKQHQAALAQHQDTNHQSGRLAQLELQAQQQLADKLPDIELAITKEAAIASQVSQYDSVLQQINTLELHCDENANKLGAFKKQLESTSTEHEKVQHFLSEHQALAPLVTQIGLVEQHIQEYSLSVNHVSTLDAKLVTNKEQLSLYKIQLEQLKQRIEVEHQQAGSLQRDVEQLLNMQQSSSSEQLEQQLNQLQDSYNALLNEQQLIVQGLQYQSMIGQKDQQQQELAQELDQLRQSYRQNKNQLDQHLPLRDEALKALNTAKQVMSLSEHRDTLIDGEPCALCGSLEHPYSEEQSVGNEMINQLATRFDQLEQQAHQYQEQLTKFDAIGKQKAEHVQQLTRETNELNQLIKQLAIKEVSIERQGKVEHEVANLFNAIEQLKSQIKHAQQVTNDLNQSQQALEKAKHQVKTTQQEIANTEQQITALESDSILVTQSIEQYKQQQAERISALQALYNLVDWRHILEVDIELAAFKRELATNIEQFVNGQESQLSLANQITHINQQIIAFDEQASQLEQQKQPLVKQYQYISQSIEQEKQTLLTLTQGRSPQAMRNELETKVKELATAHQNANSTLAQQHSHCLVIESQLSQVNERLMSITTENQSLANEWQQWQQTLNMSEQDLIELLSYEQDWVIEQRQHQAQLLQNSHQSQAVVEQLQQQLIQLEAVLNEKAAVIAQMFPSLVPNPLICSQEQRNMTENSVDATLSQLAQQQFEVRASLEQHNQAMVRFGELNQDIEQQQQENQLWQNMKELIGSADGAKFRTFAQSLTLEQMLLGANHHLIELAPRYSLERVPGAELDLQMIDKDMGDEVRSIDSLSGGETFLVSLALALGLGSLTSLQTTIRSLFIDEGFGTLDPDTLEVALSCLDSLQASGRQIGIISHVQGLVERVGTRIQVTSNGSGHSDVKLLIR
ncbi:AAA family ATPase [Psychrobium sp. nBUS_13]|uniref:AAA family ATPase n=1 Tax=Psychrobium sp. nBUS_13 TaxID=3395319 RepID=UPI003EBC5F8A